MTEEPAGAADDERERLRELWKEASTMALYVAICLFAALTVTSHHEIEELSPFKVVWGTTIGLALAHWFAFRLSARLVAAGRVHRRDVEVTVAQLVGALVVAVLATIPVLLFDDSNELDATRFVVAGFVAVVGFEVARAGGAPRWRAAIYGAATLVVGITIATLKNVLAGH